MQTALMCSQSGFDYICKKCDAKMLPNITCTCCHRSLKKSVNFKYNTDSSYTVSHALAL